MSQLSLSNVINVSASEAQVGANLYNTSNLALFTTDAFASSFGSAGYSIYLAPSQLGSDFGTASNTFEMGNAVFSQAPNILANGGYLAVIPLLPAAQRIGTSAAAATGSFTLTYGSQSVVVLAADTQASLQTKIQTFTGLSQATVKGSPGASGSAAMVVSMYGYYGTPALFTTSGNTMQTAGSAAVTLTVSSAGSGETLAAAITRTTGLVQYFGITQTLLMSDMGSADVVAAAAVVAPLNKIAFAVSNQSADLGSPSGLITFLTASTLSNTRSLYYGQGVSSDALNMMASYAGRALSTNFAGNNTTSTMHLKQLTGVAPDLTMTQTLLNQAQLAGADVYVSLQGVPAVFTSGANKFFDQVYNLEAFIGDLSVADFNYLAQSSTKVPQTESGMTGFKSASRAVCEQYVANGYIAPGSWTSSTTFGNQVDFYNNISNIGYYIYSTPVSQQAAAARASRVAPLVQIALKEAGAIQSADILVVVNP